MLDVLSWQKSLNYLDEISHSGSTAGYNAWLGRYPTQQLSVAVLCNTSSANGTQLGHAVADIYLGSAAKAAAPAAMHAAKPGLYRSERDYSTLEVGTESRFEFSGDRMRVPGEMDGGTWYERVEPWTPSVAELRMGPALPQDGVDYQLGTTV